MFDIRFKKSLWCAPLAAAAFFASVDAAHAVSRRVSFDPDYGAPFANLAWRGEAIVDYGTCDGPGTVTNLPGSCNGGLSFQSASVQLYQAGNPANPTLQTLTFTGAQVAWLTFDGSQELTSVVSTPFNPVQGLLTQSKYNGTDQAWFSLIFVGNYAQLIWFDANPGAPAVTIPPLPFGVNLPIAATYASCYLFGQNGTLGSKLDSCGISSNLDSQGAALKITPVPEPETYAMMLAGLGALAFMARRRKTGRR